MLLEMDSYSQEFVEGPSFSTEEMGRATLRKRFIKRSSFKDC
jgi:hypothetical protein